MFRLLVFILLLLLFPTPARAAGACEAPRPDDPALDQIIAEARARGGAAAAVNPNVLKAIYSIEATVAYANPNQYTCQRYSYSPQVLGLMQIKDDMYQKVTPNTQQIKDDAVCSPTNCTLSRCNAVDAMEIAARVLLFKISLWDEAADKPLGKLTSATDAYYASCRYYGSFTPDYLTNELAKRLPPNKVPADGKMSYCEYITLYSGLYTSPSQLPSRTDKPYSGTKSNVNFTFNNSCQLTPTDFTTHPLRPFPKEVQETDKQTIFCAMRPLPVGQARIDMRVKEENEPVVDVFTVGNLTQDFTEFIAPLMSITNPKKPDYTLPFNDKAQRYLLDFLEGRAYYEPMPEPANPTVEESWDLFNRLGVFRKLAPKTYQDELKRAVIQRANKSFNSDDNPYGFEPASAEINNYTVGSWQGQTITLNDFVGNWAPLPKDFSGNPNLYQIVHANWLTKDGGKWSALWPYVPMFTREDTKGEILVINSNSPPNPPPEFPGTDFIEENLTDGTKGETSHDVAHPHLARAYEVTTSLSYLLTPQQVHDSTQTPELADSWIPSQWGNNSTWLDPSYKRPPFEKYGVELGAHCDPNPELITLISSSGDFAYDDKFVTNVKRVDIGLTHEMINGPESVKGSAHPDDNKNCGAQYDCETCIETDSYWDPVKNRFVANYYLDDTACFYYKQIRSNPNYLITYTPFLEQILTSLVGSPRAVFDLFKPAGLEKKPYEEYDWPGIGNPGEDPPEYDYTPTAYTPPNKKVVEEKGRAEAGVRKPDDSQSYFYRYLGNVQCAKERVLQVLQPFISGETYKPYAGQCFPELATATSSAGVGGYTIGKITSSCADTAGIFAAQTNPAWSSTLSPNHPELTECTIGLSGCGSATTTMILNSFGSGTGVVDVWNKQHSILGYQYSGNSCLTIHNGPMQIFADAGLSTAYIGSGSLETDWDEVEKFLESCALIYASGQAHWPSGFVGGHIFVITELIRDTNGKAVAVKTLDPGTVNGEGLIRTLGPSSDDYTVDIKYLWAVSP